MLLSQMHSPTEWKIIGCKVLCKQWLFAPWRTLGPYIFFCTLLQTSSHHFHRSKLCILFCLNDSVIIRVSVFLSCFCFCGSFTESYRFLLIPLSPNSVFPPPFSCVPSLCCFVSMCFRTGTCLGCMCAYRSYVMNSGAAVEAQLVEKADDRE